MNQQIKRYAHIAGIVLIILVCISYLGFRLWRFLGSQFILFSCFNMTAEQVEIALEDRGYASAPFHELKYPGEVEQLIAYMRENDLVITIRNKYINEYATFSSLKASCEFRPRAQVPDAEELPPNIYRDLPTEDDPLRHPAI